MAVRFRCFQCNQLQSIATRMAGQTVPCPRCGIDNVVPHPEEFELTPPPPTRNVEGVSDAPPRSDADQTDRQPTDKQEFAEVDSDSTNVGDVFPDNDRELATGDGEISAFELDSEPDARQDIDEGVESEYSPAAEAKSSADIERSTESGRPRDIEFSRSPASDEEDGFQIRSVETDFEEMDLTPMVDVTFLLLIFFMITASFSVQKSLEVPPPNPEEKGARQSMQTLDDFEANSIIVQIDERDAITIDYDPVGDVTGLVDVLMEKRRAEQKDELVLQAHPAALHQTVIAVIDAANEVGMQKIRLAAVRNDG